MGRLKGIRQHDDKYYVFIILDNMSDLGNCGQIEISQGFSARRSCIELLFLKGSPQEEKAEMKEQGP